MRILIVLFAVFFVSKNLIASELTVEGIPFTYSCGYWSNTSGNFGFTFTDKRLQWGSSVTLHYGFGGYNQGESYHFQKPESVEMKSSGPWKWSADFETVIQDRGEIPYRYIDFAFVIKHADKTEERVPSRDLKKFYRADFGEMRKPCVGEDGPPGNSERKPLDWWNLEVD